MLPAPLLGELVYQPMLEVLAYLRQNGFKTYIVTGRGQDFVRAFGHRKIMLVHHRDAEREFVYGPHSKVGNFSDKLMAEAKSNDCVVISMKND